MLEKKVFFTPFKTRLANFEFSWLKNFALHKVDAFDIMLEIWIENPLKIKAHKIFIFIF